MFQKHYTRKPDHFHPACPLRHDEHPRETPLDVCPSITCRARKRCCSAFRGDYCLRLFMTTEEMRGRLADKLERLARECDAEDRANGINPRKPDKFQQGRGLAQIKKALQEREDEITARLDADWRAGKLDDTFGKWSPHGVYRPKPPKHYVEVIRDTQGRIVAERQEADFKRRGTQ